MLISIALILMLSIVSLAVSIQPANAAIVNYDTFSFISAAPNPVGVNQEVLVTYLVDKVNPTATIRANFFKGFTATITKPDGTTETRTGLEADSTSTGFFMYTPNQVGTYYLEVAFPGQWANSTAGTFTMFGPILQDIERWYKPSTSAKLPLVVQQEPIERAPNPPVPTDYWTTPIYSENKGWAAQADNWLMPGYDVSGRFFNGQGAFSPYTTAPNSAHVVWTKPITYGGLVSAQFGDKSYYTGLVYEQFYMPVILSGRIIYNDHGPTSGGNLGGPADNFGVRCLDLYNGEEIWYLPNTTIDFAQTLSIDTPNEHGVLPYLWSAPMGGLFGGGTGLTWKMYDAWTGNPIVTIQDVSAGTAIFGPKGEILMYLLDPVNNRLTMWNSSRCIFKGTPPSALSPPGTEDFWSPPVGLVADWKLGIEWNVTIPPVNPALAIKAISLNDNAMLVAAYGDVTYPQTQAVYPAVLTDAAFPTTLERQADGNYPNSIEALWVKDRTDIYGYVELHWNINEGMYSFFDDATLKIHTYDIKTGEKISVTDPISNVGSPWAVFSHSWMAYGRTYIWGYDGHVRAFDGKTGKLVSDFDTGSAGLETAYGTYAIYAGATIADHKVFFGTDEHSPDADLWRGSKLYAFNADTGQGIWKISGWYHYQSISNGYLTAVNSYDQKIYTFGKGPSATTVTVTPKVTAQGTTVLIEGMVTDQSPAQKGTPAVSDADQEKWMEYLHMQKPMPTHVTGVPVKLSAHRSDGSSIDIATVMNDNTGFKYAWTPPSNDLYTIVATFEGTESYGSSLATTGLSVSATAPATTAAASGSTDLYIVAATIVILIAIAIATVVLRKKQ